MENHSDGRPDQEPAAHHPDSIETRAVWAGEERYLLDRATQVPVVHSVGFGYENVDEWYEVATGAAPGHIYGRNTNPTVAVFEEKLRVLEGGEAATSASTGMAAISNMLHALLERGQRVVSVKDTYGGTSLLFTKYLPRIGVAVELVDTTDADGVEQAMDRGCDLLYLETPTNPTLKVIDLPRLLAAGRDRGAITVVDNTFATPVLQQPLALGADLVVHSATKFLGGHADALGGAVVGRGDLVEEVFRYREINGATLHPEAAYLLLRGMKTLHLRVERQSANAMAVAEFLDGPPTGDDGELSGSGEPPAARDREAADVGLGRDAEFRARRRSRGREEVPAKSADRAPCGEPGRCGDDRRPAGHDQPCRVHARGACRTRHPRGSRPVLGRDRVGRRLDRRSRPGTRRDLTTRMDAVNDHLAQRALALVAAPSETGQEHPAIDLISSWLEPVADQVDRWVTSMSELEADPAYPGREVERDEVPVVAASVVGHRPGPQWC